MSKDFCAKVPYLARDPSYTIEKPYIADFDVRDIPEAKSTNHTFDHIELNIKDAQPMREEFALDENGFAIFRAKTCLTPENADDVLFVETTYFNELEELLHAKYPEYERLEYLDHQIRKRDKAFPAQPGAKVEYEQPAALPHSDFSVRGGFLAMKKFFPGQEEHYENRDFDLINTWRVLRGPNNDWPLALCDHKTVNIETDTVDSDVLREDAVDENVLLHSSQKHQWYYLSDQDENDLLVFRNTDSRGSRPVAFHAAIDSGVVQDQLRQSIELRVVGFLR